MHISISTSRASRFLQVASGELCLGQFTKWLGAHKVKIKPDVNLLI